jgi:hypothetical protein
MKEQEEQVAKWHLQALQLGKHTCMLVLYQTMGGTDQ